MDHARIEAELAAFCEYLKENESKLRTFVDIGADFGPWLLLELSNHFYQNLENMGVPDNHVIWLDRHLPIPGERRRLECDLSVAPPPRRRRHDRAGLWLNARTIWINVNYKQRADAITRDMKRLAGAGQDFSYFMVTLIRTTGKKSDYKEHLKDFVQRVETTAASLHVEAVFETDTFRLSHGDTANLGVYFWRLGDTAVPPKAVPPKAANPSKS